MDPLVDRRHNRPLNLPLHPLRNDVLPHLLPPNHDSNLAPPHRPHHRRVRLRRYSSRHPPQPHPRPLDPNHLLHPLGNWYPPRHGRSSNLLPMSHSP